MQKQFKQQNIRQAPEQNQEGSSQKTASAFTHDTPTSVKNCSQPQNQHEQTSSDGKHRSVLDRIRVPVSYDDLPGDDPKNDCV